MIARIALWIGGGVSMLLGWLASIATCSPSVNAPTGGVYALTGLALIIVGAIAWAVAASCSAAAIIGRRV